MQALRDSTVLELSEDLFRIRSRVHPDKWRIDLPPINALSSTLHADVPEFVPGQAYRVRGECSHLCELLEDLIRIAPDQSRPADRSPIYAFDSNVPVFVPGEAYLVRGELSASSSLNSTISHSPICSLNQPVVPD